MATGYNLRVGDADREAVAAQLREHFADGRLTLDELNERLDQAFAAKTGADLNTVLRDLRTPRRRARRYRAGRGQPGRSRASRAGMTAAETATSGRARVGRSRPSRR